MTRTALQAFSGNNQTRRRYVVQAYLSVVEWGAGGCFIILLFCSVMVASSVWLGNGGAFSHFLGIIGVLLCVAIGAFSVGGMLGFLFGIPRNPELRGLSDMTGSGSSDRKRFVRNTNLEEVSDWITKIIIGIGLIQAHAIYDGLVNISWRFQIDILPSVRGSGGIALIYIVSAGVCGFIVLYLETQTRLTLLLAESDGMVDAAAVPDRDTAQRVIAADVSASGAVTGRAQDELERESKASPTSGDDTYLQLSFDDLNAAEDYAAWGSAQARAGNLEAACRGLERAIALDPGNIGYLIKLADIRQEQGRHYLSLSVLEEALSKSKKNNHFPILRRLLYSALYIPQPQGFQKAKAVIDKLRQSELDKDPLIQLWIAAEYGQRYEWLRNNGADETRLDEAKGAALDAVQAVIRLQPDQNNIARKLLRQIFDPKREGSLASENDLEIFKNCEQFQSIIY